MATKSTPSSKLSLFQYAFLALPMAFASLPLYIHAPDFYSRNLGLDIGLMGAILLAVRLFDSIQDPFIGYISDKYAPNRFVIICVGVLLLIAGMAATFTGPLSVMPLPLWFALSIVLATTGFSVVAINLNMIGGFWSNDKSQRTTISAWREGAALIGLLIASILPAALQNIMPAEQSYQILFWVFGGFVALAFIAFMRFINGLHKSHSIFQSRTKKLPAFVSILTGPNKSFFGVCFLTHLAASFPGVLVLFFIRDYLGADSLTGLFLILYFLSGAALMPLWVKLADNIGKERAWLASMILAVATFIWAYFLNAGDIWQYGVICVLSGTALGADLSLPPSILADRVSAGKSESEATQYYSILAFLPKIALAIASGLAFLWLDHLGFEAGIENSAKALGGLIALYALLPCFIKLMASIWLWRSYVSHKV